MKSYGPSLSDSGDLQVMMRNFTKNYDNSDKLDIVVKGKRFFEKLGIIGSGLQ